MPSQAWSPRSVALLDPKSHARPAANETGCAVKQSARRRERELREGVVGRERVVARVRDERAAVAHFEAPHRLAASVRRRGVVGLRGRRRQRRLGAPGSGVPWGEPGCACGLAGLADGGGGCAVTEPGCELATGGGGRGAFAGRAGDGGGTAGRSGSGWAPRGRSGLLRAREGCQPDEERKTRKRMVRVLMGPPAAAERRDATSPSRESSRRRPSPPRRPDREWR